MGDEAAKKENRPATARQSQRRAAVKKTTAKKGEKPKSEKAKSIQIKVPEKPAVAVDSLDAEQWARLLGLTWFESLKETLASSYMQSCLAYVEEERREKTIFPPPELMYSAFLKTPLDRVRVVIVGQDPYHQPGQAMGLCFSVPKGIKVPPSLMNVYKELKIHPFPHGDLSHWAQQGIFLLNSLLTVEKSKPMAHKNAGWADFTDKVIDIINTHCDRVIFILWGNPAHKKAKNVDRSKHFVLESAHPSPLSAHLFLGCDHFRKANQKLKEWGEPEIDWVPQ
eukprot:GEMP01040504.1.p1 GENE.GEMP01040504.1~~GEMP01040504.1.p1  ORF type:complete len:315 (+),score=55.88 GEMP01040504.1:105-947(+)